MKDCRLKIITSDEEVTRVVEYIGDKYKTTPYLYANTIKYGKGTEKVTAWMDVNPENEIQGVYLLYYDCIHFFTRNPECYPVEKLLRFIEETEHKVVMLQGEVGEKIEESLREDYFSERNYVIDMDRVGLEDKEYRSVMASRDDIYEIVELLLADPEYVNVYEHDVLLAQMLDRFDSGFSRYFVVKMDGKVVGTCSTYGEVKGLALVGGVIVHPDYRRRGIAGDVEKFACHTLEKEGISRVGFVNFENMASLILHEGMGAEKISVLAKFVKK